MLKACKYVLLFWGALNFLAAQTSISTGELLRRATAQATSRFEPQLIFLNEQKQAMPLVRELEFRSETDEWQPTQQEYSTRLSFNGRRSRRVQRSVTAQRKVHYALRMKALIADRIFQTYELLGEWNFIEAKLKNKQQLLLILEDQKKVYERMLAQAAIVEIDDLLKSEQTIQNTQREILQLQNDRTYLLQLLFPAGDTRRLETNEWISVSTMERLINDLAVPSQPTLDQALQDEEVRAAELEYAAEAAEGQQVLNFLNLKQAGRNKLNFGQEISLGVGLNIPLKSNNRIKKNEAILDLLDEQQEALALADKIRERKQKFTSAFTAYLSEYRLVESFATRNEYDKMLDRYRNSGDIHPLSLIQLKKQILDTSASLTALEEELFFSFIAVLRYRGWLDKNRVDYTSDKLADW